jgi:hypothetical protein
MNWDEKIPDTNQWKPREDAKERLSNIFFKHCKEVEERILMRVKAEKDTRIDNYDSGPGIEDIIREELSELLPKRYSVRTGVIDDRYGKTAGDCDVILFNEHWFPFVHAGATGISRKFHFPVEGTYAVLEIKTSLDLKTLDDAMKKLVMCHRLHRPITQSDRVAENRRDNDRCPHGVVNPLYSAIIATGLAPKVKFEDLINRFFAINKTLKRHEVIRAMCVFGAGTITWGLRNERTKQADSATFQFDYHSQLIPLYSRAEIVGSSFFVLVADLFQLYHSILSPEDLAVKYGFVNWPVSIPNDNQTFLPPSDPPSTSDPEDPTRRL